MNYLKAKKIKVKEQSMNSMSRYIGFGAFTTGFISGIFMATVDPAKVLSNAMIYVLSEIWRVSTQLYPEMHQSSIGLIFWIAILLLAILPVLSSLSDFVSVLSYGFLNLVAFVSGMIAGLLILINQTLSLFFVFIGILSAIFVEIVRNNSGRQ